MLCIVDHRRLLKCMQYITFLRLYHIVPFRIDAKTLKYTIHAAANDKVWTDLDFLVFLFTIHGPNRSVNEHWAYNG